MMITIRMIDWRFRNPLPRFFLTGGAADSAA
jgi:hypothetical protein